MEQNKTNEITEVQEERELKVLLEKHELLNTQHEIEKEQLYKAFRQFGMNGTIIAFTIVLFLILQKLYGITPTLVADFILSFSISLVFMYGIYYKLHQKYIEHDLEFDDYIRSAIEKGTIPSEPTFEEKMSLYPAYDKLSTRRHKKYLALTMLALFVTPFLILGYMWLLDWVSTTSYLIISVLSFVPLTIMGNNTVHHFKLLALSRRHAKQSKESLNAMSDAYFKEKASN